MLMVAKLVIEKPLPSFRTEEASALSPARLSPRTFYEEKLAR